MAELLRVDEVKQHFPIHGGVFYKVVGRVYAVDGVSLTINEGETLGLVGESGCGKSTLGRTMLHLYEPTSGAVFFEGTPLSKASPKQLRRIRRRMQIIFQDPMESLNPRLTVGRIVEEGFIIHGIIKDAKKRRREVGKLLTAVGLNENVIDRYPHEFSGGQRQRIGIARAISLKPKLIVCDEPVSALDVSVQSQIINLLARLRREMGLTMVFIAHNLAVVKYVADRVAVMYLGKIVELTGAEEIYRKPLHPYTQALIASIPVADPRIRREEHPLEGDVPSPITPPPGCHFHPRCRFATGECRVEVPVLREISQAHEVSCHHAEKFL